MNTYREEVIRWLCAPMWSDGQILTQSCKRVAWLSWSCQSDKRKFRRNKREKEWERQYSKIPSGKHLLQWNRNREIVENPKLRYKLRKGKRKRKKNKVQKPPTRHFLLELGFWYRVSGISLKPEPIQRPFHPHSASLEVRWSVSHMERCFNEDTVRSCCSCLPSPYPFPWLSKMCHNAVTPGQG